MQLQGKSLTIKISERCEVINKIVDLLRIDQISFELRKQGVEVRAFVRVGEPQLAVRT